ncbi:MAG TPA: hypothetical protein VK117_05030, partial [Pyrinomonadaceae bacterium]|nr:hypothetical protein [Pyrinomonadaceae bacterium]
FHGAADRLGGFFLDSARGWRMRGATTGAMVVPTNRQPEVVMGDYSPKKPQLTPRARARRRPRS